MFVVGFLFVLLRMGGWENWRKKGGVPAVVGCKGIMDVEETGQCVPNFIRPTLRNGRVGEYISLSEYIAGKPTVLFFLELSLDFVVGKPISDHDQKGLRNLREELRVVGELQDRYRGRVNSLYIHNGHDTYDSVGIPQATTVAGVCCRKVANLLGWIPFRSETVLFCFPCCFDYHGKLSFQFYPFYLIP